MPEYKQKIYNQTIDILRIISILAVVYIHTTTRTLEATSFDLQKYPWTLLLNQTARFGVPLFFMISGFVLELNYPFHISYFAYLKKRLSKILIPYVFWSFIYFVFVYKQHSQDFLTALITGSASYQLYFIPTLFIFYIIFPFIHRYYKIITHKLMLLVLGLVQFGLLYYDYSVHPLPFFYPLSITLLNFYIFILGIFASHHERKLMTIIEKWKNFLSVITIILIGYIFFEGQNGYLKTHNYLAFYSQWRPSVLFYTITLGGLLYYFLNKNVIYSSVIKMFARLSFVVFFIHVIVLEAVWALIGKTIFLTIHTSFIQQVWFDPLFFACTVTLSFLLAFVIQKIPILRKVSG
ncbi:acyltransferase [Candidatus Roizmanbacteria bacterium]|nr:acyltransferase [Candidatus Roizmanbacteria bacterium]